MKKILITGAAGFVGRKLCHSLVTDSLYSLIAMDCEPASARALAGVIPATIDICDKQKIQSLCDTHKPDIIIHCAGIAHQKIGRVTSGTYFKVNSQATVDLAKTAARANPNAWFLFLSSISVYGEKNTDYPWKETDPCFPSSDYAKSKLDAEQKLIELFNIGLLKNLDILRLAPVYDNNFTLNLDRRILAPRKLCYIRYGNGQQKMSALSRPNLAEFIRYYLKLKKLPSINCFNVTDPAPYRFYDLIAAFKQAGTYPGRMTLKVPLFPVWLLTRIAGQIFKKNCDWWHACHDKLARDITVDNTRMIETGFKPQKNLSQIL